MQNQITAKTRPKHSLSRTLTIASIALILAPFPKTVLAEEVSEATSLPTLTVEGNALYHTDSSEELTGYNTEAATVGTKTPAALKDIPQSITVLTNDFIEARGFIYLDDISKKTPGLVTLANDSGRSSIYSRGYEYDDALIDGLSSPISSKNGTLPSLSAFDRIEIMRGPSGLFSSTSEMGGIINLVRKRATEDTQASVDVSAGSWGRTQLGADVSGSLNDDGSVRGRLVISQADASNQVDGNDNISESLYGTLDIDLDEKTELSVGILYQTKDIKPQNGLPTYDDNSLLDIDSSTFIGADWNDFNNTGTNLFTDLTRQFNNGGRGRIATRYTEASGDSDYVYGGGAVDSNGGFTALSADKSEYEEQSFAFDANYSQPFEVMGNVSEFVVGMDYKQEKSDSTSTDVSYIGTDTYNINTFDSSAITKDLFSYGSTTDSNSSESEQAVYGKLTFRPIQKLAIITGARVSNYDIESGTDSASGSHFTPYAGTVYDLTDTQALYASYSEVFKPQTSAGEDGDFIDPREGQQIEFGVKGTYDNGLLNSRLTVYQLTDSNRAAKVDGTSYYENTGEYQVQGFEAELSGQFGQWDMLVGYTYTDTEILSGDSSRSFSLMPEHTFNAWSKYSFGDSANTILNEMTIGAGLTAISGIKNSTGTISASSYTVIDTAITKQITSNLNVSLKINNLLDEKYYTRVGNNATFNFYGTSRNFMASANYTF
ncbi:TonB-dependent siderophore receptor [Marinomonas colpomeniae]|uniref:TonB-dependent siderophore receptor n=1 Tax=Marinomonas colpomeniae TaxID=2774408 RepID=A0ABR8NVN1_9GAMM|nr:TonB-dependent siderophore receptor [Marinomonas colpomeniae]MBD5770111.1 TonB-dependent siderophore receptor [Marinomonas colpomeniae]